MFKKVFIQKIEKNKKKILKKRSYDEKIEKIEKIFTN
jgi:hypothetical protein